MQFKQILVYHHGLDTEIRFSLSSEQKKEAITFVAVTRKVSGVSLFKAEPGRVEGNVW